MDADRHAFDEHGERVPAVDFDFDAIDATPQDITELQRELYAEALRLQRLRGFCEGEAAAERAVIVALLSGRLTKSAIVTRIIALARKHGHITTAAAIRLTGKTDRALRKALAKVPPNAKAI